MSHFQTPEFYNDAIITEWNAIEIHPVIHLGEGSFETCEPEEADFYSVYLHAVSGGLICIADVPTEQHANELSQLIENIIPKMSPNL